jgi:hypothetical protein
VRGVVIVAVATSAHAANVIARANLALVFITVLVNMRLCKYFTLIIAMTPKKFVRVD